MGSNDMASKRWLTVASEVMSVAAVCLSLGLLSAPLLADEPARQVTALRPPVPQLRLAGDVPIGDTLVDLDRQVQPLADGAVPSRLEELRLLEQQQSLVAEKIQSVTVNIQQGTAQGSGVIITTDGYVLTAAHVAGKPDREAWVVLSSGERLRAKTLGMNRYMDAGLIKIVDALEEPLPYAALGHSAPLKPGMWCIAAGHPGGWVEDRPAVIRVGRLLSTLSSTLVSDCSLIGGDSGGPLFDLSGCLIGIHSRIGTDVRDNMHVPIDVFSDSWERMVLGEGWGTLPGYQPIIGVTGSREHQQAVLERVSPDGPAARAGLKPGDVVRRFDRQSIETFGDLVKAVEGCMPGERVRLEIERDGRPMRIQIVVGQKG